MTRWWRWRETLEARVEALGARLDAIERALKLARPDGHSSDTRAEAMAEPRRAWPTVHAPDPHLGGR